MFHVEQFIKNQGLYVHIPFCKSRCGYCNFYRITDFDVVEHFLEAIIAEMSLIDAKNPIDTVYFGGGTPSSLPLDVLERLFENLYLKFDLKNVLEFTFEANPEDVDENLLSLLKKFGVNRISLGVQSLNDDMLRFMNRRHNSEKVYRTIELIRKCGFENVSVDIIFGLPVVDGYDFKADVRNFLDLDVDHISAYALSYENGSRFFALAQKNQLHVMPDDDVSAQYDFIHTALESAGYEHYEISNFARSAKYSRHNYSYWKRFPYYALGPSASSFDGKVRRTNIPDLGKYISSLKNGSRLFDEDILTDDDVYNEIVMLGMRTKFGVDAGQIENISKKYIDYFLSKIRHFINEGFIENEGSRYRIAQPKWFISDYLISELFI